MYKVSPLNTKSKAPTFVPSMWKLYRALTVYPNYSKSITTTGNMYDGCTVYFNGVPIMEIERVEEIKDDMLPQGA